MQCLLPYRRRIPKFYGLRSKMRVTSQKWGNLQGKPKIANLVQVVPPPSWIARHGGYQDIGNRIIRSKFKSCIWNRRSDWASNPGSWWQLQTDLLLPKRQRDWHFFKTEGERLRKPSHPKLRIWYQYFNCVDQVSSKIFNCIGTLSER